MLARFSDNKFASGALSDLFFCKNKTKIDSVLSLKALNKLQSGTSFKHASRSNYFAIIN